LTTLLTSPPDGKLVTADEVADHLNLPKSWVRERTRAGDIPCRRFGKYVRYSLAEVRTWAEKQAQGGQ
jgi:excisionase family DNA binding protein